MAATLNEPNKYVSRAALKLESVAAKLNLNFKGKIVLDVGASTGGFSQFALTHGAARVYAVEKGTDQLHSALRLDPRIISIEKTDIRDVTLCHPERSDSEVEGPKSCLPEPADPVLVDVSFISVRDVLPAIKDLLVKKGEIIVLVKPQFESGNEQKHRGIIKNDKIRRQIFKDFEQWAKDHFVIQNKADSKVAGSSGNRERFYRLKRIL
jgi:23S rRNA (cytidine1920-2'-O)/16S rRNA (cytidine1409-2'-O)-methyltransferase